MDGNLWESIIPETAEETTQSQLNAYVFKPALVTASDERVEQLENIRSSPSLGGPAKHRLVFQHRQFQPGGFVEVFEANGTAITKAILAYSQLRPHASCDYLTPNQAHQQQGPLKSAGTNMKEETLQIQSS